MNQKEELKKDVKKSGDQSKKKKKLIAGIAVGVAVIGLLCAGYYYVKANEDKLKLKEDVFSVEYGEKISLEAKDYVTADESILKETKVKINHDVEKEKDYAAIGTYDGSVTYMKENHEFKVEVKDTTAPVFKDLKKEIKVEQNAENVDFTKYFKAEDLSKVKITVNDKKIDLSKTGEYELEVTATDAHDNKTTKKIKVVVVEADKADEVTETTDGEKPLSAETKQKKEEQAKVEQANTGGNSNTSGGSSGDSTNGGSSGNNGGGQAPAPQPNGIGAVINTAYGFVGRTDMTCNDLVVQSFKQNNYDTPYDNSYYMGYSVGADASVLQAGDMIFTNRNGNEHVMLVTGVSGSNITVVEGGINGLNVVTSNHVVGGNTIVFNGIGGGTSIVQIRRY